MITIQKFVADDFDETVLYDEPVVHDVSELAPYFDEFIADCRNEGREIPEGLTAENYTEIWNEMVTAYQNA